VSNIFLPTPEELESWRKVYSTNPPPGPHRHAILTHPMTKLLNLLELQEVQLTKTKACPACRARVTPYEGGGWWCSQCGRVVYEAIDA
jgi:hypothetical protein